MRGGKDASQLDAQASATADEKDANAGRRSGETTSVGSTVTAPIPSARRRDGVKRGRVKQDRFALATFNQPFVAQAHEGARDDLAHGPDRIGDLAMALGNDKRSVAIGSEVQQMPGDARPDGEKQ